MTSEDRSDHGRTARLRRVLVMLAPAVAIYVASRIVTLVAVAVAATVRPELTMRGALTSWDSSWYLRVAEFGYPSAVPVIAGEVEPNTLAFFPLFPAAIRVVQETGLSYFVAGLLVSTISGLGATALLWCLLRKRYDSDIANRGVALFCFFPGSFILSMIYSEPLMLMFSIGCLLALLDRRWLLAGTLAALASATRPNGIAVGAACAWAALIAIRQRQEWRALVAPMIAPLGLVGYLGFVWLHTDDATAWLRTQRDGWKEGLDLTSWFDKTILVLRDPLADVNMLIAVLGLVFVAVSLTLLVRQRPPGPILAYTLVVAAMAVAFSVGARPRFILTAFPLVTMEGSSMRQFGFSLVIASYAGLLGAFTVLSLATITATP